MSIERNYYVIAGYDLTDYKTDKYEDWKWNDEGQRFTCYQRKGNIQLFDDPMSGEHLYLGYILADGDEYDFETTKFNIAEIEGQYPYVTYKLQELQDIGVISKEAKLKGEDYRVIVFEECL